MAVTSINLQAYLQLATVIKYLPKQDFWTAFDAQADVLYINFHQPALSADDSELTEDDIIIRYKGDEIIGLSILNISQRYLRTKRYLPTTNMTNFRSPHEKTFNIIKEGLSINKQTYREAFTDELRQKEGYWSRFRYFLFLHPNFTFLIQFILFFLFIVLAILFNIKQSDDWIRIIFIIIFMTSILMIPLLLLKFTPKFEIGWDRLWPKVLGYYLSQSGNDIEKAKHYLRRAIWYYKRKGKALNFIVNFLWGSIFIGCLPDSDFQHTLITLNVGKLFALNSFGAMSVIITPLLFIFYIIHYDLPVAWMENVLTQIELDE